MVPIYHILVTASAKLKRRHRQGLEVLFELTTRTRPPETISEGNLLRWLAQITRHIASCFMDRIAVRSWS